MLLPTVKLKTARQSRHPWIFRKMVEVPRGFELEAGALVRIADRDNRPVGFGFYHPVNTIALRVLSDRPDETMDADFFRRRLLRAAELREAVYRLDDVTNAYRLLHGEADGFPALVLDRMDDLLVAEPYAVGWTHLADWLSEAARSVWPGRRLVFRVDPRTVAKEGADFGPALRRHPPPVEATIRENGLVYRVDFAAGHKTGFFADQRDNRLRARRLAAGRTVLDCCCYTGGFSLSAAAGGAERVEGIDLDEDAVAGARDNLRRNLDAGALTPEAARRVEFRHADAYDHLRAAAASGRRHDLVILDPPKFAAGREDAEAALKRYADLNRLGLDAVAPGGFLITCSCSGAVARERWVSMVRNVAMAQGVRLQILEITGPGVDHPVSSDFPEGEYLKVMFARVWPEGRPTTAPAARRRAIADDDARSTSGRADRRPPRSTSPARRRR